MVQSIAMKYQYFSLGTQLKSFKYCYLTQILLCINNNSFKRQTFLYTQLNVQIGGARGVMVIIVEKGHGDTISNSGRG